MAAAAPTCDDEQVPRTVLIVDDHPSFRGTAHAVLEAEGFAVVGEAADGAEALAKAAALRPDVVLLDLQPPAIDGFCSGHNEGDRPAAPRGARERPCAGPERAR